MKKLAIGCAAALAAAAAVAAENDVFEVSDVDELTNACAKATSNFNTIKLKPRVYDLTGIVMDRSGSNHLVVATYSGQLVGTGPRPEDTVIKGGGEADGCRILRLDSNYCTVSNLTFTGGYIKNGSGGVANNGDTTFTDCVFSNNYAQSIGGALDQAKTLTRCKFIDNHSGDFGGALCPVTSGNPGVFRDCWFEGNHSKNGGVAYYGASWSNCVFVGNYSMVDGGCFCRTRTPNVCIDCHFTNNVSGRNYSVGESVAAFTNCTFYGNSSDGDRYMIGMIGSCPSVYGCEFASNTGMPLIASCTLRNCTVADTYGNMGNSFPLVKDSVLYNCLVARNTSGKGDWANIVDGWTSAMYNCTVVSNAYNGQDNSVVGCAALVNTLLVGNYIASTGKMQDLGAGSYPSVLTNCLWTAQSEGLIYRFDQARFSGGGLVERAGFVDAAGGDFRLARSSPARNAGWSDSAYLALVGPADLAGGDRVYMDDPAPQIDVGCFEFCRRAAGVVFLFW